MFGNEVLVNVHEKKILDFLSDGHQYKMREISDATGYSYNSVSVYLKLFRELDWVKYERKGNYYWVNPSFTFKTKHTSEVPKVLTKQPLAPTFEKWNHKVSHDEVKVYHVSPEQVIEMERKAMKHKQWIELKKGEYIQNESYRHPEDTR